MAVDRKKADKKTKADQILNQQQKPDSSNSSDKTLEELERLINPPKSDSVSEITPNPDANPPKHAGGRKPNKEKGLKCRKQYTITLEEDTYKLFMEKAREEKRSLANFLEFAAYEYIKSKENNI